MADNEEAEALALSRNFLTVADVELLKRCARTLPRSYTVQVIDLGCGSGTTALAILEAHPRADVVSYDISQDNLNWTEELLKRCGYIDRWQGYRVDAVSAAQGWIGSKVDAVMLDASHLYQETLAELKAWVPLVRRRGWVWCHDYQGDGGMAEGENGVRRAVDEYVSENQRLFTDRTVHGLGIALHVATTGGGK